MKKIARKKGNLLNFEDLTVWKIIMETTTHVSLELLGLPVEGIHDLPDGHGDDVDGDQGADDQV